MSVDDMLLRLERAGLRREPAMIAIATGTALTSAGMITLQPALICYGLVVLCGLAIVAMGPGGPQHPVRA